MVWRQHELAKLGDHPFQHHLVQQHGIPTSSSIALRSYNIVCENHTFCFQESKEWTFGSCGHANKHGLEDLEERVEEMGLAYNIYLNSNRIYGCKTCKTHLSNHDDIISRVSSPSLCYPVASVADGRYRGRTSGASMGRPISSARS